MGPDEHGSSRDTADALAAEFLQASWTTYGLVELRRAATPTNVEALDRLTWTLASLNRPARAEAIRLLQAWVKAHPLDVVDVARFKLRMALMHKADGDTHSALRLVQEIDDRHPSPTLFCLRGNLLANRTPGESTQPKVRADLAEAITWFERSQAEAPSWIEPVLEQVECHVRLGEYEMARHLADTKLESLGHEITERERLILQASSELCTALLAPAAFPQPSFAALAERLRQPPLPEAQREKWHVNAVVSQVLGAPQESGLVTSDLKTAVVRMLWDLERRVSGIERCPKCQPGASS